MLVTWKMMGGAAMATTFLMLIARAIGRSQGARLATADYEGKIFPEALEVVSSLVTGTSRDRIAESLLNVLHRALGAKKLALLIPSRAGDSMVILQALGLDPSLSDNLEIPLDGESNVSRSIREARPVAGADPMKDPPGFPVAVPVVVGSQLFGVLGIADTDAARWPESHRKLLTEVVTLGELALAKVARFEDTASRQEEAEQNATHLREVLGSYVSPTIATALDANPDMLGLGGELREVTVLFADIMDFTTFCEYGEPTLLLRRLNEYLTVMADIILEHDGTIDKFLGDQIMAYWNAPVDQPDHAFLALQAAMRMHQAQDRLKLEWEKVGRRSLRMGISLNAGSVVFGHIGSAKKKDITILGDTVNLGARLEKLTRVYQVPIIVGPRAQALIGDKVSLRCLGQTEVKGKEEKLSVYGLSPAEIEGYLQAQSHKVLAKTA